LGGAVARSWDFVENPRLHGIPSLIGVRIPQIMGCDQPFGLDLRGPSPKLFRNIVALLRSILQLATIAAICIVSVNEVLTISYRSQTYTSV
jgi:hypothetical protein